MKATIISILVLVSSLLMSQEVEYVKWYTNIDTVQARAKTENKIILMDFSGSDWCANCIRLEKTLFQTKEFAELANEKLVLLRLDFPAKKKNSLSPEQVKHNEQLAEKYNKTGGFPTVLFIDFEGRVLAQLKQPQNTLEEYLSNINAILNKN